MVDIVGNKIETGLAEVADFSVDSRIIRYEPLVDTTAGYWLGSQAIVITLWWIVIMFVYIKNVSTDPDLITISGSKTVPIGWIWERIAEYNGTNRYLSLSLLHSYFLYAAVSATEAVTWILYMFGYIGPARWYFRNVGYWGAVVVYALPPMFAFIQMVTESTITFPGSWALF